MEEIITYRYDEPSMMMVQGQNKKLRLSAYNEEAKNTDVAPILFMGRLTHPALTARALTGLAKVASTRFIPIPSISASLRDPIVSVGSKLIRFEAFSGCAGVYVSVDVLPEGLDGTFLAEGSTNVDFNSPLLTALGGVGSKDEMNLCIGPEDVSVGFASGTVVERKVPLPVRWLKALGTIPIYLSDSEYFGELSGPQAAKICRSASQSKGKGDHYLARRGSELIISSLSTRRPDEIPIGGLYRLQPIAPFLALAEGIKVYAHPSGTAITWRVYLKGLRFSLTMSREPYRGFSGEGAGLGELSQGLTPELLSALSVGTANRLFVPVSPGRKKTGPASEQATALAAMGLLGYDLDEKSYFHRRLPFKLDRLLGLNPRLKGAEKLLAGGKVEINFRQDGTVEGRVEGSGVWHSVVLSENSARCTCLWTSKYKDTRGPCKHILAVKKAVAEATSISSEVPRTLN